MLDKIKQYVNSVKDELDAYLDRDPAARSRLEIALLYSGFQAVQAYRVAHWFYERDQKFIARVISQAARSKTGVEIHPGAKIGKGCVIDHGMGVVIGETAVIGDNCTIYQNVTLGGTGKDTGKRHPTLGNNVLVGSGAKVLGPFTVHDGARVAAGAVVLEEIPENATAVGVPAQIVRINGMKPANDQLDQIHVENPISEELHCVTAECEALKAQLADMQKKLERLMSALPPAATADAAEKTDCGPDQPLENRKKEQEQ